MLLHWERIIFTLGFWVWSAFFGFQYPWALAAVTLAAGISFVDDIHSLPDSVRLVVQLVAMLLLFVELGIMQWSMWWVVLIALFVSLGATNIINFMDGINGITGGYSLAVIVPVMIVNAQAVLGSDAEMINHSFLNVVALSLIVFCIFNFRSKNKAKCFAGDVGSVGIGFILLFVLGILNLIYDVLLDGFFVNIAHRLCVVPSRPKAAIPLAPHVGVLVKYHQCRLPFQVSNKVRYAQLRRNVYAQMYMICTYRSRHDFYFFVLAQCTDDLSYIVSHFSIHYLFPVLRDKHNMVLAFPTRMC